MLINRYATYSHQYHSKARMNGDTTSTNISRKSSIGSFINAVNNTKKNSSRKSSIGIFRIVSVANDTEEEILQGTIMLDIFFTPIVIYLLGSFFTIFSAQ